MRVGTTGLAEPYTFYRNEQLTGFDMELVQRFALWCNADLKITTYDWAGTVPACTSGKEDYIISGFFVTEENSEVLDFSDPYMDVETVMVIADGGTIVGYISIQDLTKAGDIIRSRTYEAFFPLIATAAIYFVMSALITALIGRIEVKIDPRQKPRRLPKGVVKDAQGTSRHTETGSHSETGSDVLITVEHLKKAYPNSTPLKDVNTTIHRGEVITVIGPSGTGKSTLLRCLNHPETPTDGRSTVFGYDLGDKNTDLRKIRRRMGMVFQRFNLFGHLGLVIFCRGCRTLSVRQPLRNCEKVRTPQAAMLARLFTQSLHRQERCGRKLLRFDLPRLSSPSTQNSYIPF